ncbi:MAG TPA: hypothetical protein VL307_02715 [Chitinophagaceae bacterium]|nr:hypothetical protein [Chitinophagaceae bacterium]
MKKRLLGFFAIVFIVSCSTLAMGQNVNAVVKAQANDMARAVMAKDVNKLATYMPPKLLAEVGGKDKLMVARDTVNKMMKQFGAEIQKITIGDPSKIVSYKKQLQTTLPQTTEIKFMASKVFMESTLIAVSEDKGAHWYFVDTSVYRGDKVKNALPDLSPELVIPPMKKPRIVTEE